MTLALSLMLGACGGTTIIDDDPGSTPEEQDSYPSGPYGLEAGDTVEDYAFDGYARPANGIGPNHRERLSLADFHNPSGTGSYPQGSPLGAGATMPRALVLSLNAVWATPGVSKVNPFLPEDMYQTLPKPSSELLMLLADGINPGVAAEFNSLDNWVGTFGSSHPAVIQTNRRLADYYDLSSFPMTLLIDLRDMSIKVVRPGIPDDAFWAELKALAGS